MKAMLLILALLSLNAFAAEFPSKDVDRKGISGNLKQTASDKTECVKKVSEAALKQMQIKGLKTEKVNYHADLSQRLMKSANDRGFRVTLKDEGGKEFLGAIRVMFFHTRSGIACRPIEVDFADGDIGKFYRWQVDKDHENGSVKYVDLAKEFLAGAGPNNESCMKDPACSAAVQAAAAVPSAGLAQPASAATVLTPNSAGR